MECTKIFKECQNIKYKDYNQLDSFYFYLECMKKTKCSKLRLASISKILADLNKKLKSLYSTQANEKIEKIIEETKSLNIPCDITFKQFMEIISISSSKEIRATETPDPGLALVVSGRKEFEIQSKNKSNIKRLKPPQKNFGTKGFRDLPEELRNRINGNYK